MPADYPRVRDYKPFYIQAEGDGNAIDIAETYGLVVKTYPLTDLPAMKSPAVNKWLDEDGDDEYLGIPRYEAQEYEVKFYMRTTGVDAVSTLENQKKAFFAHIRNSMFSFYDSYWRFGRRNVRYMSYNEESKAQGANWARIIFSIKFKINDPITDMVYDADEQRII